jgi:hypothetical protein
MSASAPPDSTILKLVESPGGYEKLLELLKPSPHRVLPVLTRDQIISLLRQPDGEEQLFALFKKREEAIKREETDPYRFGMVLPPWRDAISLLNECMLLAVFGGNRASKTEFGAYIGVDKLVMKAGANVLWLHESEQTSVDVQQIAVQKYLPAEWKNLKKGAVTNVSYTRKNGFSDNKFVLPNRSVGKFGSYKQDIADYEGLEYDLIIADENLPLYWLRTLLVRLATRQGKFIWSFTPIRGVTPAVKELTEGAKTLESRPAELLEQDRVHVPDCPAGHMPYVQKSIYPDTRLIYFHSIMNPYGGYETLKKILTGMERADRERRGYGYARNTVQTLFPQFSSINVIEADKVPERVTRYQFADPAGARNMFMIWVAVDEHGRHFIYREWPDVKRYGEWALPSEDNRKWDGIPGPAQPTLGFGVAEYKRMILEEEGNKYDGTWDYCGEKIEQRFMDPRSGKSQSIAETTHGSSLMDRMVDEQFDERKQMVGPSMDFTPAPGLQEGEGFHAINDLLSYDRNQPITAFVNEPKLYVVKACFNTIWALKNYTSNDGEKAACKDPIDDVRYMATAKLQYLDPERVRHSGGGSY